jgi:hypothetical protein
VAERSTRDSTPKSSCTRGGWLHSVGQGIFKLFQKMSGIACLVTPFHPPSGVYITVNGSVAESFCGSIASLRARGPLCPLP